MNLGIQVNKIKIFVDLRGGKMAPLPGFAGFQAFEAYGAPGPAPFSFAARFHYL